MAWVIKLDERESICCSAPLVHHHIKSGPYNSCSKCNAKKCGEKMIGQEIAPKLSEYERGYEAAMKEILKKAVAVK